jgi:DNA-binding GntR family transcriptional regulator
MTHDGTSTTVAATATRLRPGRRPHLSDEVAAYLRDLIMSGQVRAGEFLRLESVADTLNISVTPVREALVALRREGFVYLEPNRGFVVSRLSAQDVKDLFWVQAEIAGELAARATTKMTPEAAAEIREIQDELERAAKAGDADLMEELNFRFHRAINRRAESPKLAWMLSTVVRYAPRLFYASIHGWKQASMNDHNTIIDALTQGREMGARAAMHQHIVHAGDLLVAHLGSIGLWDELDEQRVPAAATD